MIYSKVRYFGIVLSVLLVAQSSCTRERGTKGDVGLKMSSPKVVFWGAAPEELRRMKCVKLPILAGYAELDGRPLRLEVVAAVVQEKLYQGGFEQVMLIPSADTKFGDLVRLIAECRKTNAKFVLVNDFPQ